jgi:hypothetical protein
MRTGVLFPILAGADSGLSYGASVDLQEDGDLYPDVPEMIPINRLPANHTLCRADSLVS